MAQIIPIVSEALQSTIRRLLPSQNGFGEDLQAQNVIVPIIDLTPSAEGSLLSTSLQQALAFGSQTEFIVRNTTSTIITNSGFYRVFGAVNGASIPAGTTGANFSLTDGLSTKILIAWEWTNAGQVGKSDMLDFDFIVFLAAGQSLTGNTSATACVLAGSTRQIASSTGELVNPSGFVAE
jgi:hypothetical protein